MKTIITLVMICLMFVGCAIKPERIAEIPDVKPAQQITAVFHTVKQPEETTEKVTEKKETSKEYIGNYKLTAYCPCYSCSGGYGASTSTGAKPKANHTIAVDPKVIPYGTKVLINGKTYVAEDCGGAIKGNRIDIYFNNHQDALNFGVQYADVYIVR